MEEKKLTKEILKELASDIMLDLTDAEIESIQATETQMRTRFRTVTSIDTDGVEPLSYPFEQAHTYLREDDDIIVNDQKNLLTNAPSVDGDFITIVKVVK